MKGTDCTPEQVDSARDFIIARGWPSRLASSEIDLETFARMVAWYGALRYRAGRDGTGGTFEEPGPIDDVIAPPLPPPASKEGEGDGKTRKD